MIVDTPGPNEAGENLRLSAVVADQLQNSSIVLIVLDFTQLNNQAAEGVKKQVQPIIDLLGKENLYVLVNKVDQRRQGDMTPEDVKKFVASDLELGKSSDTEQVFEIAAIQAFSATKFLLELQQNPDAELTKLVTAESLAQEVFGIDWEEDLEDATTEELEKKALKMWKKSGFAPFLDQAINVLMETAAPRCMMSALNVTNSHLLKLLDDVKLRGSAIAQQDETLKKEVDLLKKDMKELEVCRERLKRKLDKIQNNLKKKNSKILEDFKKKSRINEETLKTLTPSNRSQQLDFSEFIKIIFTEIQNSLVLDTVTKIINFFNRNDKWIVKFQTEDDAKSFESKIIYFQQQQIEPLLLEAQAKINNNVEESDLEMNQLLDCESQTIIFKAQERLRQTFEIDLKLKPPSAKDVKSELSHIKFKINYRNKNLWDNLQDTGLDFTEHIFLGYQRLASFFFKLWNSDSKDNSQQVKNNFANAREYIREQRKSYDVELEDLIEQINKSVDQTFDKMKEWINQYLDNDFENSIKYYFGKLNDFLQHYQDNLVQAQQDKQLSLEKQNQLIETFNDFESKTDKCCQRLKTLEQRNQQLMPSNK
ncbi:MAG: dynamin family protein [Limnoraphis sp.]